MLCNVLTVSCAQRIQRNKEICGNFIHLTIESFLILLSSLTLLIKKNQNVYPAASCKQKKKWIDNTFIRKKPKKTPKDPFVSPSFCILARYWQTTQWTCHVLFFLLGCLLGPGLVTWETSLSYLLLQCLLTIRC